MGVKPDLVSLWKAKVKELVGEDERKTKVVEVFRVLTGGRETPKTEGYTYSIAGWLDDEEHKVKVNFWVESTREPRTDTDDVNWPPKAIANIAFLAVAKEILEKTYKNIRPYATVISVCSNCNEVTKREYGLLIGEENIVVYVLENYGCQCEDY